MKHAKPLFREGNIVRLAFAGASQDLKVVSSRWDKRARCFVYHLIRPDGKNCNSWFAERVLVPAGFCDEAKEPVR